MPHHTDHSSTSRRHSSHSQRCSNLHVSSANSAPYHPCSGRRCCNLTLAGLHVQAIEEAKDVVRCWLTPTGIVLCVNENFTDWFATAHGDIVGKPIASLAVEQDRMAE
jgi:hypothetical protein